MGLKELFTPVKSMDADETQAFMKEKREDSFILLDVRQPNEYEQEHIPGAKLIPLPRLADALHELDPAKPTIVYCAIGGRSRVAAQLLSGKGFKEVYNLKGGIKAWNGLKAAGPREFHLTFITKDEKPEQMLMLAYHMEEALRVFYLDVRQRTTDRELGELLARLAEYEHRHTARIIKTCQELGISPADTEHITEDIMEGGFDKDVFLRDNAPYLHSAAGILTIAMMLETQSLDLYLRLADEIQDKTTKAFLFGLADEEKKHLAVLAALLEKKPD